MAGRSLMPMSAQKSPKRGIALRDALEDEIAEGRLAPGERLDEVTLAERFGVSRTPVREALRRLAEAGFVEIRPHRGAVVSAPDPRRIIEMFEVMAELEALCARLAARRLLPEDDQRLRGTLKACGDALKAGDPDAYYYENEQFHRAIYAASGNEFLADEALALHKRLAPFRRLQLRVRNRMRTSQHEHQDIVAAIRKGDAGLAAERLRAHVAIQGERFSDLIASIEKVAAST